VAYRHEHNKNIFGASRKGNANLGCTPFHHPPFRIDAPMETGSARTAKFVQTDQCDSTCPVSLAKTFAFSLPPNQIHIIRVPS
jgi:hypothetical protein